MNYSEKELNGKLMVDNLDAFRQIFKKYYKPLVKYARRFVMDIDSAEDFTQQTFLYIWEKRRSIKIGQSLKSYKLSTPIDFEINEGIVTLRLNPDFNNDN